MSSPSRQAGPIRRILQPIRGRLIVAAVLAGTGSMLTLVPLAGIARLAHIALDPALAHGDVWRVILASVACLFAGMALISLGELAAHLADNRLTHRLRLLAMQRLGQVPLGWFTSRASGEVKQAMQDDINTLHSLTAVSYTHLTLPTNREV